MLQGRKRKPISRRWDHSGLFGLFLLAMFGLAGPAAALVSFDFETPFLVHPGLQVWDFCLVTHSGQYHAFYHTIPPQDPHPSHADTIWHAASPDLQHWEILGPAVTSGPDWWDEVALWAPDVVFDDQTQRWAMLYTGVSESMVQRACLAWSDDLNTWEKSAVNPVFEPDSVTYYWSPITMWSPLRDPFLYHDGQFWNMLSTAFLRVGGVPGIPRGIVHRAVSADLENWQDAGVFFENDGATGQGNTFESVQYLVRDGWHHLFFVEQDPTIEHHPTSHLVAASPAGWTMAERTFVDTGWAPEIKPFATGADGEIFARLAKDQDPRDGTWFVTAKFDTIRFTDGGLAPVVTHTDLLGSDWPTRTGSVAAFAPTFGENPALRGSPDMQIEGHGWFGSAEGYGGPLSGVGFPGAQIGDSATGRLESLPFVVAGGLFSLLLAGGGYPGTCFVGLVDDFTGELLTSLGPQGESALTPKIWDVREYLGRSVRLVIVDEETAPGGWLAVDAIEEVEGTSVVRDLDRDNARDIPFSPVTNLVAYPNPFNSSTYLRCQVERAGSVSMEIFDLAGRILWRSVPLEAPGGEIRVYWDGRDMVGRGLPSGNYFCRVIHDGIAIGGLRLNLVK